MADDASLMGHALRLAARGLYTTDPNPRVGCVIARDGEVVGEGWHQWAGDDHAEIRALAVAGERARGADVYLTLEPCCHQGRTPPCTDALIAAGVRRVVCAMRDPNPAVAGNGFAALAAAGIEVVHLERAGAEARRLNPGFIKRMRAGRPWVRIKTAMSLDGRTALADGESRWITGEAARRDVHRWRARASCILTGRGTVVADDPALTVRLEDADEPVLQPVVAIVDPGLAVPTSARLFDLHARVLVLTANPDPARADALARRGAEIVELPPATEGGLDLPAACRALAGFGINEIHVEAGATLCGALLDSRVVDEILFYMAPALLGADARGAFAMQPLAGLDDRLELHLQEVRHVGRDLRIRALPITDRE